MRAILAIQKQQQQFGNQVSVSEHSGMEGGTIEVNESQPTSPLGQYDSSSISMTFDNCSVEESVLYRLQDTISKVSPRFWLNIFVIFSCDFLTLNVHFTVGHTD